VISRTTGWDELRIRSSWSPSGGHARPGFAGLGFPEDKGEEIGEARGSARGQSSSRPFRSTRFARTA